MRLRLRAYLYKKKTAKPESGSGYDVDDKTGLSATSGICTYVCMHMLYVVLCDYMKLSQLYVYLARQLLIYNFYPSYNNKARG